MKNLYRKARPYCKINLGLHVVGRRPDGYHDIETIFVPVRTIRDRITIHESATPQMIQNGITLDNAPEDNLCMRAWRLLHDMFGVPPVTIHLQKNIPFGAGLGGGSSDAASTLQLLNERYLKLPRPILHELAARLGADCPFFLYESATHAYATGIGDQLETFQGLNLKKYRIVIGIPKGVHVSTKEAYAGLKPDLFGTPRPDLRKAILQPIEEWKHLIVNDFESSVFPAYPAIAALKEEIYARGALYASMTGSGAAVYGIFPAMDPDETI